MDSSRDQQEGLKGYLWGCGGCVFSGLTEIFEMVVAIAILGGTAYAASVLGDTWAGPYLIALVALVFIGSVVLGIYIFWKIRKRGVARDVEKE